MYIDWTDEELEEASINKSELEILLRHFERANKKMEQLGLWLFVANGQCCIMDIETSGRDKYDGRGINQNGLVARFDMSADGGDW